MSVFIVAPDITDSQALTSKIHAVIPTGDAYRLPGGVWMISFEGTTRTLSDSLGISNGTTTNGAVFSINAYWGHAGKDVWEWLGKKSV